MNNEDIMQDQIITQLIAELQTQDPPPNVVRTALDQVKSRLGNRLGFPQPGVQSSPSSRPTMLTLRSHRTILRFSIAAAIIGSVALWQWMPTDQAGAGVAFGQVLDTIREATSMTYTVIEHPVEGEGESIQFQVHGARWIRVVAASKGVGIIDLHESKLLQFDHPAFPLKSATLTTFVGLAGIALQDAAGPFTKLNDLLPSDGEPLGNTLIDGNPVTGFRVRRSTLVDGRGDHSVWDIWADTDTAQVVRVDIHHEIGEGEGGVVLVDFHFDADFEPSLFDLVPPPGYTITYETVEEIDPADR